MKKAYGKQNILKSIDLSVKKGEVVVIIGPSGCGKSTLLRCINALEPIHAGSIELRGEKIVKEAKEISKIREKIGMVFQSYELFPHLSVLDNITLAPLKVQKRDRKEVEEEAKKLLRRVGLEHKAKNFPR